MDPERPGFADAHVHISEDGFSDRYPDVGDAEVLFGCTARESEWDAMRSCDVPGAVRFYGVHPWYADGWDDCIRGRLESILRPRWESPYSIADISSRIPWGSEFTLNMLPHFSPASVGAQ